MMIEVWRLDDWLDTICVVKVGLAKDQESNGTLYEGGERGRMFSKILDFSKNTVTD